MPFVTVKSYSNTNYNNPVYSSSLPWPYSSNPSFSAMLWVSIICTELVHGVESAEDHFLFKGWGKEAEL